MWTLLVNPVVVALAAAMNIVVCRLVGADPHLRPMLAAAGICLLAAELGILPAALGSRAPVDLMRATLAGSAIHLLVAVAMGALVILVLRPGTPFIFWLLAMYWITLITLCVVFVRFMRAPATEVKSKQT